MEPRPGVMTVREAAVFLRISESKLMDGLRRGLIPGQKVVGQWRLPTSDLHRWLRGNAQSGAQTPTWP